MSSEDPSLGATGRPTVQQEGKTTLVLMLRHGEREDEVMPRWQRDEMSEARRFDPVLTLNGHQQAREAWKNISLALNAIQPKKVAIFTSPLRRTVGTAMMASEALQDNWKVSLPTNSREGHEHHHHELENENGSAVEIPIVIWNGLCDCAAQINRCGGHRNAIKTGYVSCAATEHVTPDSFSESSMAKTWSEMRRYALESALVNNHEAAGRYPIRFWKVSPYKWNLILVPMTPKLYVQADADETLADDNKFSVEPSDLHVVHKGGDCEPAVDHVVRHALLTDCDVCIIVSHREEIRDHMPISDGKSNKAKLPYCCVGVFSVFMHSSEVNRSKLHWRLHEVRPYQDLTPGLVEQILMKM